MSAIYETVTVAADHPLRPARSTYVYKHRIVLWEKIGSGAHPCHHCGCTVTWSPGERTRTGSLVVDHLDDNPRNNDPGNLVPSCHPCNQTRAARKNRVRDDELFIVNATTGTRIRAVERNCEECGETFLAPPRKTKQQKFCSRPCSSRHSQRFIRENYAPRTRLAAGELFVIERGNRLRAVLNRCEACGKDFAVARCYAKKRRLCGRDCRLTWIRQGGIWDTRRQK